MTEGHVVLHYAQPDSGTNHGTSMSIQVGGNPGVHDTWITSGWSGATRTSRRQSPGWNSGLTTQLQGGALCNAADKLRKDLLKRASETLKVDAAKLQITRRRDLLDGRSEEENHLCGTGEGQQRPHPHARPVPAIPAAIGQGDEPRHGSCFAEVEVDTWTGDWRYVQGGLLP